MYVRSVYASVSSLDFGSSSKHGSKTHELIGTARCVINTMAAASSTNNEVINTTAACSTSSSSDGCATSAEIIRHVMSVVDGAPSTPPAPPCNICKSAWFCTCGTKNDASPWAHLRKRPMGSCSTVICRTVMSDRWAYSSIQDPKRPRGNRHALETPEQPKAQSPQRKGPIAVAEQTTWEAAKEKLKEKVWRMPSCRQQLDKIFGDCNMLVQLAESNDYIGHGERLLARIPTHLCFKVGMSCDPHQRFYLAGYAYIKPASQRRDLCNYDTMSVIHCDIHQQVVAMYEHCLIKHAMSKYRTRCRNMRAELDDYTRFQADSGDESVFDQTWFCYVVFGSRIPGRGS